MAPAGPLVFAGRSVAAPVIKEIVTRAFNYLHGYFSAKSMEEMKSKLERGMPKIQALLDVVSPDQIKDKSRALDAWFWQLRDAVEEAEDAIDELEYYELEEKAKDRKVSDYGSSIAKMRHKAVRSVRRVRVIDKTVKQFTHRGTLKRLMKAMDGLDQAAADITDILAVIECLNGAASGNQRLEEFTNNDRQTGSILSAPKFVGRKMEKKCIIEWLTKKTSVEEDEIVMSTNRIPIFSLVGHGGMGKTTLVQSICQLDEVVKDYKIIWVTVSTSFDATWLTRKILESVTGERPSASNLDTLQRDLKEKLMSVKFLLILDDVWEEERRNEWEKLFAPLRTEKSGSKILLTTRMASVAEVAANVMGVGRDCLTIERLEEDENLELFNHHVFSGLNSQDYGHLKMIGEQIARKLGGCPLVTKVASGHLQGNMTCEFWNSFLHKGLEYFKGTKGEIMNVLKLSYYHLPTELQICFRYCSLFPEDHEFDKKELLQMWMGSALISQVTSDPQTFEDTAEQFLAQLTRQSFFDLKSGEFDQIHGRKHEYYVMHDLMHELAKNVSSGECARTTDPAWFEEKDRVRHLYVDCIDSFSVEDVKKISHFKNLRPIIIGSQGEVDKDIFCALEKIVESSNSLRLIHSRLRNTFNFTGNLKHLRYIYQGQMSPEGICRVAKLYHLILLRCDYSLQRETKEVRHFGNLDRLRYVSYGVRRLGEFPVSRLTYLQELNNFRVRGSIGNKISSVGNMRSLRKLQVQGIENIENHEEVKEAKLKEKLHLSSLSLEWSASTGSQNRADDLVFDHLEPHSNVRELQISGYEGFRLPFWIENLSVKNLISLRLERCINWEYLPSLGELALLKYLFLENLSKIQHIGQSSHISSRSGMELSLPPSLENLEVRNCEELRELPILPLTLVRFKIYHVGLTKLPLICKLCCKSTETKPSELLHISVEDCPCLTSLEGSLLEQTQHMGALRELHIRDCIHLESASLPFEEMNELEKLSIVNCPRVRTPTDAGAKILPSSLRNLTMGQFGDLELPLLGSLQRLSNLWSLGLYNCSGLVSLPSSDVFNTSLKSLRYMGIYGCENLSSLGGLGSLQHLVGLKIKGCSKLAEVGSSHQIPHSSGGEEEHLVVPCSSLSIHQLVIDLPCLLLVEPLKSLSRTEELTIEDGSEMESLPEWWLLQNRQSLKTLWIGKAKSLESLPPSMRDLSSLRSLNLCGAENLRSLSDLPSSLRVLQIYKAKSLESLPPSMHDLSSLEKLSLSGAENLRSLPDMPSSLRDLQINEAKSLESLPPSMRDLSSLKELYLFGAENLRSLLDLPSSLQTLYILGCNSELEKKSREHGSPEWNKISHIGRVRIGNLYFIMGQECSK